MPAKNNLTKVSSLLAVPGARFTQTALLIDKNDERTITQIGRYLQTIDACVAWWWGDFIEVWCQRKLAEENAKVKAEASGDEEKRERLYVHYTAEYARLTGRDEYTVMNWREVAAFYEVGRRRPTLSWSHHQEAMNGSQHDIKEALKWLDKAEKTKWSKTQLRAAIRSMNATGDDDDSIMPSVRYAEVIQFKRWASITFKRLPDMQASEAKMLRADLQPALELARELDVRFPPAADPAKSAYQKQVAGPPGASQRR